MADFLNLPTKEQFDVQNGLLASIASHVGTDGMKISNWEDVQRIVRMGLADKMFTVGDQFVAEYNGSPTAWNVIGINHDKPTDKKYTNSLTLQAHDCIVNAQFDAPEPTNPDANRLKYGSNNYMESAIKQWLNSNETVFNWIAQTEYDVAPTGAPYMGSGFLKLLDPELVNVIGRVDKQVAKNTITDGGGQDVFSDKIFLLSQKEIHDSNEGVITGEEAYPYYSKMASTATNAEVPWRVKYLAGSPRIWWLRSPSVGHSHLTRIINPTGYVYYDFANNPFGVSPACVII